MAIVVIKSKLTFEDLKEAREDYEFYIKITVDIEKKIIALGGEYHADAEKVLIESFRSSSKNIWGGGYNIKTKNFETNAMINLRPGVNDSMEIIDSDIRKRYIDLVCTNLQSLMRSLI